MKKTIQIILIAILVSNAFLIAKVYFPKSDLIDQVLNNLEQDYVDPERLEPYKMLKAALENLARNIPPVVLKEIPEGPFNKFTLQVGNKVQNFNIPKVENLDHLSRVLQPTVRFIKENLTEEKDLKNVDYVTINGFLSVLDHPYTSLLIPEIYTEFREDTGGNYSGVGMYIGVRNEKLQVISPIFNSPAYKAGLQSKDIILQINGESTINMSTGTASSKIKGPTGTSVNLLIERESFENPKNFKITRDRIALKSVTALELKTKKGRIGYIPITRFHQKTAKELDEVLESLQPNLSDFQGIIIDLRNNPGGILNQAVRTSNRFLSKGKIVTTTGINEKRKIAYDANSINTIRDIPIILLINRGSASASEIVAAALKQNSRALLIGEQSFGKGSVQRLKNYRDGSALKLTIAKYLTPDGSSLHSVGIIPHIEARPWVIQGKNVDILQNKKIFFRNDEDKFAEWGQKPKNSIYTFNYLFDRDFSTDLFNTSSKREDIAGFDIENIKKNYLLHFAANILNQNQNKDFTKFLESALQTSNQEAKLQNKKLQEKLSEIDIDWMRDKKNIEKVELDFWVETKNDEPCKTQKKEQITAGNEIHLCTQVKNNEAKKTVRLLGASFSEHRIFQGRQFVYGNIAPKKLKKWYVNVNIPDNFSRARVPLEIKLYNGEEKEIQSKQFFFDIAEKQQPRLHYQIQASSPQKTISKGNAVQVNVTVKNEGQTNTGKVNISLKNGEGNKILLTSGKDSVTDLGKEKQKKSQFGFDLKDRVPDNKINLSLSLVDNKYLQNFSQEFSIPYEAENYQLANTVPIIKSNHPLQSEQQEITLGIQAEDDKLIKDIYLFKNNKKEFYQSFAKKQVQQNIPIKLKDGVNKLTVYARDNYDITTSKEIFIYKK